MRKDLIMANGSTTDQYGTARDRSTASPVLKNTYRLLSLTLVFSGVVALTSTALKLPSPGLLITLLGYFGLLFATYKTRNSGWGLVSVFALTGFMGYTLGPMLNAYLGLANGGAIITTAMATTAVAFIGLSIYARSENAIDMLRFGPFLMIGILVAFCMALAAILFQIPALSLAVSGMFVMLMCGLIVYETQNIVRGGETNYIMATVTLFVAAFNLFTSLLHLLGFAAGDEA